MVNRKSFYFYSFLAVIVYLDAWALYPVENDGQTQVIFWNVGQGNCTLIKTPEFDEDGELLRRHITLIDAGTNSLPIDPETKLKLLKRNTQEDLATKVIFNELNDYLKDDGIEKHFNAIFSHPDEDHINLGKYIIDFINGEDGPSFEEVSFYLGSKKEVWESHSNTSQKLLDCIKSLEDYSPTVKFSGIEGNNFALQDEVIDFGNNNHIDFLFGQNLGSPPKENNQESLVVRYQFGNISALISGDATGETGEAIFANVFLKQKKLEDIKVNILLSSHHGARKEGCNSKAWASIFQPQHIIFSTSGRAKGDTKHPQAQALANYYLAPYQRLARIDWEHSISFFGEDDELPPPELLSKYYISQQPPHILQDPYMASTSYSLYSTAMSGDIVCTWDSATGPADLQIKPERKPRS